MTHMPTSPRATYGGGSVYRRSSDGRWIAAVVIPTQRGEKRRRKTFTSATRAGAQAKLDAYREQNPARTHLGREGNYAQARAQGRHTRSEWWRLVRSVKCRCAYCDEDAFWDLQKDHVVPVSRGGSDAIDNIAVSCKACNVEKGTMTADEYRAWKAARAA